MKKKFFRGLRNKDSSCCSTLTNISKRNAESIWVVTMNIRLLKFFTVCTKLAEMAILYSKHLTIAKKITSSGARPDATDYYWFRSPVPNQMS